jgi:serine protease
MQELTGQGVTVVAAAGNEEGLAVTSPANCPGVIAVAAVRHLGTKVGFSSIGPEVALSAPGGNCVKTSGPCLYPILTTTNSGADGPVTNTYTNSFDASVGTSFAVPQVAGTIGLMLSLNPSLSPAAIRTALQASARPFPTRGAASGVMVCQAPSAVPQNECYCTTTTCGAGMLDAAAALALAFPPPTPVIAVDNSALQSSNSVLLSAAGSSAASGRTVVGYQWSVVSGSQYASFVGRTSDAVATLLFVATRGTTEVDLKVTDSAGASASTRMTLNAALGPTAVGGSSGGGGSLSILWTGGLLAACAWLWGARRARRRHSPC